MTYDVFTGTLNPTHSLTRRITDDKFYRLHEVLFSSSCVSPCASSSSARTAAWSGPAVCGRGHEVAYDDTSALNKLHTHTTPCAPDNVCKRKLNVCFLAGLKQFLQPFTAFQHCWLVTGNGKAALAGVTCGKMSHTRSVLTPASSTLPLRLWLLTVHLVMLHRCRR